MAAGACWPRAHPHPAYAYAHAHAPWAIPHRDALAECGPAPKRAKPDPTDCPRRRRRPFCDDDDENMAVTQALPAKRVCLNGSTVDTASFLVEAADTTTSKSATQTHHQHLPLPAPSDDDTMGGSGDLCFPPPAILPDNIYRDMCVKQQRWDASQVKRGWASDPSCRTPWHFSTRPLRRCLWGVSP
jgi:hypothetical protein